MDDADRNDEPLGRLPRSGRNGREDSNASSEPNGPRDPKGPRDPIETVLRLTGPRPAVPDERSERVREAVHAHWRGVVEARAARRRVWTSALFVTAAAAAVIVAVLARGVGMRPGAADPQPLRAAGTIEAAGGPVRWIGAGTDVRPGSPVHVGSELSTEGGDGRLAIRWSTGHSVRLGADSRLRIVSATEVALDRGVVYVDSGALTGSLHESLGIVTPLGSVLERGTQYEVRSEGASIRVRVREGAVSLKHRAGALEVAAGHEVEVDAGGQVREGQLTAFDQGWEWIGAITPMMTIEGRSAREFLDWIARERGLQIRFATSELETAASRIRLNGSIEGMSLEQALASVLPTCGMAHRIDQGVLWVAPAA